MSSTGYPVYGANGVIGFTSSFTHEHPTILIGCRGTIGSVHITQPRSYASSNAMALDCLDTDSVEMRYLARFLEFRGVADVTTGSSQPQLTRSGLSGIEVPVPPMSHQKHVADVLDRAEAARVSQKLVLDKLMLMPQAVFQQISDAPQASSRDGYRPLEEWIDPQRPITYGILKPGDHIEGGTPYVRVADMKNGGIELAGLRRTTPAIADQYRRSKLATGDLLISIRGHVGRLALVPPELDGGNITQDSARLAVVDPTSAAYLRVALESPTLQHWMAQRTKGAAVRGINLGDLRQAPIPVPSRRAQGRIAAAATEISWLATCARQGLVLAEQLFASLQARAFTGQL
ncbi:restriction endonuclease subunit S [Mycobacterium sp. MYCO198283]|nr:restriction endonuclease subunit S [Mycobacterium sp. MYCO198283]